MGSPRRAAGRPAFQDGLAFHRQARKLEEKAKMAAKDAKEAREVVNALLQQVQEAADDYRILTTPDEGMVIDDNVSRTARSVGGE